MAVDWDIIDGARVKKTRTSIEIIRPVLVYDLDIDCTTGLTNPSVLLAASAELPPTGTVYHDPAYPAILEAQELSSVRSSSAVVVDLVYRLNLTLGNPNDPTMWIKTLGTQSYQIETHATANGNSALKVYYKSGLGDGPQATPANAEADKIGKARRTRTYKVLRVRGRMYYTKWLQFAPTVELAEECINSDTWGSASRGQWLCLGPTVDVPLPTTGQSTANLIATIEIVFVKDKLGHYPLIAYQNERREHPKDAISEANLRARGLPQVNSYRMGNGKTLASVYPETTFSDKFIFTP